MNLSNSIKSNANKDQLTTFKLHTELSYRQQCNKYIRQQCF